QERGRAGSQAFEEVLVESVKDHWLAVGLYPDAILQHQRGLAATVDQFDPCGHLVGRLSGAPGEGARREEDAAVSLGILECTDELVDRRTLDRVPVVVP